MAKSVVIAALAFGGLLSVVSPALAEEVLYTTSGVFSVGGTNVFTGSTNNKGKTATVTYNAYSGDDIPSIEGGPPALATVDSLGAFTVFAPPGTVTTGSGTFLLTIDQSIVDGPSGSSDFGNSVFSGKIKTTGGPTGSLILSFAQTSITIDNVTYTLENLGQNGLLDNQLAFGKGGGQIVATITSPVPEPAFFGLTGLGFFGLAFVAMRRYKKSNVSVL
jgi:hypothetical protein